MSDFKKKMEASVKKWKQGYRLVAQCLHCGDEFYSKYSGEFKECQCSSCFVDQTPHYARFGGDITNVDEVYFPELDKEEDEA
jgi:hypothetical protein